MYDLKRQKDAIVALTKETDFYFKEMDSVSKMMDVEFEMYLKSEASESRDEHKERLEDLFEIITDLRIKQNYIKDGSEESIIKRLRACLKNRERNEIDWAEIARLIGLWYDFILAN